MAVTGDSDGYSGHATRGFRQHGAAGFRGSSECGTGCMDNDVNEKIGAHVGAETRRFLSGDEGSAAWTVYVDPVAYGIAPASGRKEGDRLAG